MVNKTELFPRPKTKQELQALLRDDTVIPNNIHTALIKDMRYLFIDRKEFNKPINRWNTKNVTNMSGMFQGATSFNQKIVVKPQPMEYLILLMGYRGTGLNLPSEMLGKISEYVIEKGWDTSNVIDMKQMFCGATSFNQPVESLDTKNVLDMSCMFYRARSFNQPVGLNTKNVTDMKKMFSGATSFNQPVECLDTKNVTNMSYMFCGATSFNQPVEDLNTSKVTNMGGMFCGATSFNQPVEGLDTSKATNTRCMFVYRNSFNNSQNGFNY